MSEKINRQGAQGDDLLRRFLELLVLYRAEETRKYTNLIG